SYSEREACTLPISSYISASDNSTQHLLNSQQVIDNTFVSQTNKSTKTSHYFRLNMSSVFSSKQSETRMYSCIEERLTTRTYTIVRRSHRMCYTSTCFSSGTILLLPQVT
ncbi:hypothetical protein J6590_090371, partial [Homalodisca vitripennis]